MAEPLMQLLLTPPICNQNNVQAYATTQVAHPVSNPQMNNLNAS